MNKRIVFLLAVDNVPDDIAERVITLTTEIVGVWNDRNNYGGKWSIECLDGDA